MPKVKDGPYVINLDKYESVGTHWIALYVNGNDATYFDSFGAEHISEEIGKFISDRNITKNILEYKHMIQQCVDAFVLDLLIIY